MSRQRRLRPRLTSILVIGFASLLSACLDSSVTFPVTREFAFSSSDFPIITDFQEEQSAGTFVVPSIPCSDSSMCPSDPQVIVDCRDGLCDPAPTTTVIAMQEVDLTEVRERFSMVDSISLRRVEFDVLSNTVNREIPALNVYWGAVGVTDVSAADRLGTFPAIPTGTTPIGEMDLDAVGTAAMNDYLARESFRFVIFLETTLDIDPGDEIPSGDLQTNIQFTVRASGRVI